MSRIELEKVSRFELETQSRVKLPTLMTVLGSEKWNIAGRDLDAVMVIAEIMMSVEVAME